MRDKFLNKLALMRNMHNFGTPVDNNAKRAARKRYGRLPRPGVIYIPRRHLVRPPPLPYHIRKIYENTKHHYKHDNEHGHHHKKNNKSNNSSKGLNTLEIIISISVLLVIITLLFFFEKTR